jgi:ABC-type phosphate transport system auxiliary subunit
MHNHVLGQSANFIVQERQNLIQQWEDAVAQMRRTDSAIETAAELFASSKLALRKKQQKLDIAAQFLDDQIANNKECEGQIETLERDLARLRTEFNSQQVWYQYFPKSACIALVCLTMQLKERYQASCVHVLNFLSNRRVVSAGNVTGLSWRLKDSLCAAVCIPGGF